MSRIKITVEPDLLDRAPSRTETIRIALTEVIRQRLNAASGHRGRIELDLDQETLQRLRRDSS